MNLVDLKNNMIDIINETTRYLNNDKKVKYNNPTSFTFNFKKNEWKLEKKGLKEILVHPFFKDRVCANKDVIFVELCEIFESGLLDRELINIFKLYKKNLFLVAEEIMKIDKLEEDQGRYYITYEQLINTIEFTMYHLDCAIVDSKYLFMTEEDELEYNKSIERLEFLRDKSDSIEILLLRAQVNANFLMPYKMREIIQREYPIDFYKTNLEKKQKMCA